MDELYQQFLQPASEFAPMPFWFWNDRLDKDVLRQQIEDFQQKGVDGFVLHPRKGIPEQTKYLSEEFMEYVQFAVKEAANRNMHVILYDEAMYPSGAANGKVVEQEPTFASRGLKAEVINDWDRPAEVPLESGDRIVAVYIALKKESGGYDARHTTCLYPLNAQVVKVDQEKAAVPAEVIHSFFQANNRKKDDYACLFLIEGYTEGTIRGVHPDQDDGERNAPPSADLLNPAAVQSFIDLTHERYKEKVGNYFGNTIFAMFTDEPDITGRNAKRGYLAWTKRFEIYLYQEGLHVEDLPGLFFDIGAETSRIRQTYHKAIDKRMLESYYIPIAKWCKENNLYLTGHPAKSDDIGLLKPFTIPGQDVVWRWVAPEDGKGITGEHSTAGKCGSDAARHYGRRRNLNEYLGVCGLDNSWNLSASDMKWYTDWLAVRGVNLFCPHAFYYSVEGRERSHERPPDVGLNNVWWPYYSYFSTYIKRISWLMADSVNQTEIAILALDHYIPWKVAATFYQNQMEFNYVHESLFKDGQVMVKNGRLLIGEQSYLAVVVDELEWSQFDNSVLNQLKLFADQGGNVYVVSNTQQLPDFKTIDVAIEDHKSLLEQLTMHRYADLTGDHQDLRITKVKKDGRLFYFMTNEGDNNYEGSIQFRADQPDEQWNPWTGERSLLVKSADNSYYLTLPRRESIIWAAGHGSGTIETQVKPMVVAKEWTPTLQLLNQKDAWNRTELLDWAKCEELQYFSGAMEYQFNFDYDGEDVEKLVIDLGEVHEIAEVTLNDSPAKVKMWSPYSVAFSSDYLLNGKNTLHISITNNSANEMDHQILPSGLFGPIKIIGKRNE
ncbi:hypothetical protein [Gracilibacillus salinarum]|uniref:Glycosyl hydrolases family 2 sugar binding domain-containing protein n=1 Tax=Gracilibacillus salinarum TaxID=2932255 RepID=A0ABY4GQD7_9BACI|nr:hypothetical protein [Gracilibacillus salinarum]UOQ86401.1 hypothetical protein MUN87_05810 [Gracilibacillus salinarum]